MTIPYQEKLVLRGISAPRVQVYCSLQKHVVTLYCPKKIMKKCYTRFFAPLLDFISLSEFSIRAGDALEFKQV